MKDLYCCGCTKKVSPRLTDGKEIYPHRPDLHSLPFWRCDDCSNYVGCHHKTKDRTRPLGCIPTPEIKRARQKIHRVLDPLWQNKRMDRREIYAILSDKLGRRYHTANIRNVEEAEKVCQILEELTCLSKT